MAIITGFLQDSLYITWHGNHFGNIIWHSLPAFVAGRVYKLDNYKDYQ
nr:hypothetical protein [Pedobacter hiemivivus]